MYLGNVESCEAIKMITALADATETVGQNGSE